MPRPKKPGTIGAEREVASRLVGWLAENDRTQSWLERRAGMPGGSLRRVLLGERTLYVADLLALSAATGLALSDLLPTG